MPTAFYRILVLIFLLASVPLIAGEPAPDIQPGEAAPVEAPNEAHWTDARWSQMDIGPFLCCGLPCPAGHIHKGTSVRLGADEAAICFDSKNMGVRAIWTGGFLKFDGTRYGLIHWPIAAGPFVATLPDEPCWGDSKVHYMGMHLFDKRCMFRYRVDEMIVLETPALEKDGDTLAITRSFRFTSSIRSQGYALGEVPDAKSSIAQIDGLSMALLEKNDDVVAFAVTGGPEAVLAVEKNRAYFTLASHGNVPLAKILMWSGKKADIQKFTALVKKSPAPEEIKMYSQPSGPRWGAPLVTQGKVSTEKNAYVVDTITAPYDNPFKAMLFLSGLDFFDNGDAAICTLHGDVWRVSGINDKLEAVTWKRFATGLFQPIGLKIISNNVYVLGRDQITILRDFNRDDEADYYENFNNDCKTSSAGHDYSAGLETDVAGNYYHVDPYGLHRISKKGDKYVTLAAGWRNPVTLGVGPNDELTVSPQEGNWTPSSEICSVVKEGWYGFGGPKKADSRPLGYDPPLCYIPHKIENSTGGHVWVSSEKWGPFDGKMLNLSFGQAIAQVVLQEKVDGIDQGGVTNFPLRFLAGTMRGRFRLLDGQLYVVGTKGWQTVAPNDGAFQRVRYTGAPVLMPSGLNVLTNGIRLTFTDPLKKGEAEDADNYSIEQWAYHYAAQYGSDDWSIVTPDKKGRDEVKIKSAKLSDDGKSVELEIPDLKPVMQMQIKYKLLSASGAKMRGDVYNTINKVPAAAK